MKLFFTEATNTGHPTPRLPSSLPQPMTMPQQGSERDATLPTQLPPIVPPFETVYEEHFDLVFRNVRRLGVPRAQVDDAVQDVFLVVHRRLREFEGRSSLKTWILGIVRRVASDHRRSLRRKSPHLQGDQGPEVPDAIADETLESADEAVARREAVRLLHRLLDELDEDKRVVFVFADLEGMSVPEIADILGENLNTVYARLRAARLELAQGLAREKARDTWRLR